MNAVQHRENIQGSEIAFGEAGPLSPREHESVVCTAEGLTSKQVARVMGCSVRTANCHIEGAMNKLGARNRVHLVWLASSRGLIVPAGFVAYGILLTNIAVGFVLMFVVHLLTGIALSGAIFPTDHVRQPARQHRSVRASRAARGRFNRRNKVVFN